MAGCPQKASDAQISSAYAELQSVWRVAERLAMCGQSVHERLTKLGIINPMRVFTKAEKERLSREYQIYVNAGKLGDLAIEMQRTRQFLCRQAKELGLTDQRRPKKYLAVWKYLSEEAAETIWAHFKASRLGLGQYCTKYKYDDLGFAKAMKLHFTDEWDHVIELKAPKSGMYRLGRQLEYRSRDDLKRRGYFVTRSPQSRSPVDLVAIASSGVLFVQCKRGGSISPKEWNEIFDLAVAAGATPLLCRPHASARGIEYFRLTGRKDGSKKRQPYEPFLFLRRDEQEQTTIVVTEILEDERLL